MADTTTLQLNAPPSVYRQRRARLAERLQRPLVICAGFAPSRNYAANAYPFRAGSSYLYFGGPPVEGAAWLIRPGSDGNDGCTLLRTAPTADDIVWLGPVPSDTEMTAAAGLADDRLAQPDQLGTLLADQPAAVVAPPGARTQAYIAAWGLEPAQPAELLPIIELRLLKDVHEMQAMHRAAEVNVEAQRAVMAATAEGRGEADAAAAFFAVLVANQCRPSFTPIISVHGEILHGQGFANRLDAGRLLLVDAGAEEPGGYACDITRTYPVNGSWTSIQRHFYETVLRAVQESLAACVPGRRFRDVHDLAAKVLCEGLVQAELLRGDPAELAGRYAHTLFFCHGLGHLIGLDVHDMEDFGDLAGYAPGRQRRPEFGNNFLRLDRDLEPGLCLTIEPGIYLVPAIWQRDDLVKPFADAVNRPAIDALLKEQFGGIRIEETICITDTGPPEVLSRALPSDADAVAGIVGTACAAPHSKP